MHYLKIWTSFRQVISPLADDEKGRLFDAMLSYVEDGSEPTNLTGREALLWPAAKVNIDNAQKRSEINAQNGSKGGIAKRNNANSRQNDLPNVSETEQYVANCGEAKQSVAKRSEVKQSVAKCSETKQNVATCSQKKRKEIYNNPLYPPSGGKDEEDDDLLQIQQEQNEVLDAAEKAGFGKSDSVREKMIILYAEHGKEDMLWAIDQCVEYHAVTFAYLRKVLSDKGKKPAPESESDRIMKDLIDW